MKILKTILTLAIIASVNYTYAQLSPEYYQDGVRFSQTNQGSTSRIKAIGGAQTALGGDISSIFGNPAGIGLFTKSEFSFTPGFNSNGVKSTFLGQTSTSSSDKMNINNAGVAWSLPVTKSKSASKTEGLLSFNFGIGYSRINDFNANQIYTGTNNNSSIADRYAEFANENYRGVPPFDLPAGSLEGNAYDTYLIGYDSVAKEYFPQSDLGGLQTKIVNSKGSQSEIDFTGAINISNKFYLGASIGFTNINYSSEVIYNEKGGIIVDDLDFSAEGPYDYNYNRYYNTKASGINGKVGFIYRPIDYLRVGASLQTPTWYTLDDDYIENMDVTIPGDNVTTDDNNFIFNYMLKTPAKYNFGIALIDPKLGFITGDVEFADFTGITFNAGDNNDAADHQQIQANNSAVNSGLKSVINYRLGAEVKVSDILLRAGYNIQGNPFNENKLYNNDLETLQRSSTKSYSAGLGYRVKSYYFDLTYQNIGFDSRSKLTDFYSNEDFATQKNTIDNVFLTMGVRF